MTHSGLQGEGEGPGTVGILAGNGLFPICFARRARARGVRVVAVGIEGEADPALAEHVDEFHWTGAAKLGMAIRLFKGAGVQHLVMLGGVTKANIYRNAARFIPDWRTAKLYYKKLRSREDHTVLEAIADEFAGEGITVESSLLYCPEMLAPRGCLTRRNPTDKEWDDVRFAWPLVKQVAAMQIGQTIVVKHGSVVAVEGMDGTDATLRRGGEVAHGKVVAVKVAKEDHDDRFDVPCIGPGTVDVLAEAEVTCLAVEAGQTVLLEREELVRKAAAARVCILAVTSEDVAQDGPPSQL